MNSDLVTIHFAGKEISCRANTTIAVALWESGIRHLSHSHKYGRDRGLTCARGHTIGDLMRVDGIPNIRTSVTPVRDGMRVEIQDAGAFYGAPMQKMLNIGGNFFPVGFYYKWFTKPAALSRFFLGQIRPLTGVGRIPDPKHALRALPAPRAAEAEMAPTRELGHIETIVLGAGPSGMLAALENDGPVTIIDDHSTPGGQRAAALDALAASTQVKIDRFGTLVAAHKRLDEARAQLLKREDITFRGGTQAIAAYKPGTLVLRTNDELEICSFTKMFWTTGALDSLGLFPGNDTPGIVGPRAVYRLLMRDGLKISGQRVLLIGGGLDFWLAAALLADRGAHISLVVTEPGHQAEVSAAVDLGWQLTTGLELEQINADGHTSVEATFSPAEGTPGPAHSHLKLKADFAVICRRGKPVYDLLDQLGVDLAAQRAQGGYVPRGADGRPFTGDLLRNCRFEARGEAIGAHPGGFDNFSEQASGKAEN